MFKKYLETYFFGYAAFKWRRLIRTLLILPIIASAISGIYFPVLQINSKLEYIEEAISDKNEGKTGTRDKTKYRYNSDDPNYSSKVNSLEYWVSRHGSIARWRSVSIQNGFLFALTIYLGIISFFLVLGLISWLIKPFVVEESSEITSKKSTKDVVIKNEKPSKKYSINEYLRIPLLVIIYSFLFFIQFAIALYAQMDITGRETGSMIVVGTVFALISSYRVCKFINKKLKIKPINN